MNRPIYFYGLALLLCTIITHEGRTQDYPKNLSYSLSTGTSIGFSNSSKSFFNTYVIPQASFTISPKMAISFGTEISKSNFRRYYSPFLGELMVSQPQNITTSTVFVNGSYRVSDKLTIIGGGYKQFDLTKNQNTINPRALDFDSEGVNVGFDYKINENLRIGAEIGINKGNPAGSSILSPFGHQGFNNFNRFSTFP